MSGVEMTGVEVPGVDMGGGGGVEISISWRLFRM